jgi:hypothetical protein
MRTFQVLALAVIGGGAGANLLVAFHSLTVGLQTDWPFQGWLGFALLILCAILAPLSVIGIHRVVSERY